MQPPFCGIGEPIGPTIYERLGIYFLDWPSQLKFRHSVPECLCSLNTRIGHERPHRRVSAHQRRDHEGGLDPLKSTSLEGIAIPKRMTSPLEVISVSRNAKNDSGSSYDIECW